MKIYALYIILVAAGLALYSFVHNKGWIRWIVYAGIAAALIAFMAWASEPDRILSDFKKAYYASGSLVIDDPDALYPDGRLAFTNIPIVGWLFVPIAQLPVNAASVVWTAIGVVAVAAACWGLIVFAELTGWRRDALVGLFLINGPLFNSLREGNLTHVVLLALVGALWLMRDRRDVRLGVLLGVCVIIKPPLALLAVPFVLRGQWRFAVSFAGTVGTIGALSLAVFGLDLHRSWYDHSVRPFSEHPLGAANVQSIDGFLARLFSHGQYLGDYTPIAEFGTGFLLLRLGLVALILAVVALTWWRARLPATADNLRLELCIALCVSLVVGPISWSHYYALTLIPLALILGGKIPFPDGHAAIVAACLAVTLISPPVFLPRVDTAVIGPLLSRVLLSNYFYGGMLLLALLLATRWNAATRRAPRWPEIADTERQQAPCRTAGNRPRWLEASFDVKGTTTMAVKPIPDGYNTVTPYLVLSDAAAFIEFAQNALGATERMRAPGPNGTIMHAEVQLGDSVIMLADTPDTGSVKTAMLHIYVEDVDAAYKQAVAAGGESLREPIDQPYGDRSGAVKDRWGNEWWLATHIKDVEH